MTHDPQFPRSPKHLHGAPDPGPWPYLALVTFAALAATCILIANYI